LDSKPVVSIVRCEKTDDRDEVRGSVAQSLDLIGGLNTILRRGDQVLIKPNLVDAQDYRTGAITNPNITAAIIDLVRESGAKKIIIADGSCVGTDTTKTFDIGGYTDLAKEKKVELVDIKKSEFIPMGIPNGKVIRRIQLPRTLLESDIVINVPVMKTHDVFPATLGLKNMKGVIQEKDKKRFHTWGLAQCIVDLNKLVLPQITVIDGTIAMEGLGPANGTPVNFGILCSSFDTVAVDVVASLLMGIEPESIEYLKLASEQGLGCGNISEIDVRGLNIEDVKRKFQILTLESLDLSKYGIEIIDVGACSGCRNTLTAGLNKIITGGQISKISGATFVLGSDIGKRAELETQLETRVVKFGTCSKLIFPGKGIYFPGCPPHPDDFEDGISS
jgi:uncharacterized protein (DUF362 family)